MDRTTFKTKTDTNALIQLIIQHKQHAVYMQTALFTTDVYILI